MKKMFDMSENNIKGMLDVTMEKLRALVDADTVIGTPITVGEMTLIPVSRVSFGLATGGTDLPSKTGTPLFGGGGGAGVSITPIAFIAVHGDGAKLLPVYSEMSTVDKAISMAPELIDKVKSIFSKDKPDSAE